MSLVPVPSGTSGAISELLVCADLLRRGYEVFRSVSPNASCDMLVRINGYLVRIEVTTGRLNTKGGVWMPNKDRKKYDILAILIAGSLDIMYEPPLEKLPLNDKTPEPVGDLRDVVWRLHNLDRRREQQPKAYLPKAKPHPRKENPE